MSDLTPTKFYLGDDVILPDQREGYVIGTKDIRQYIVGMHEFQALEFLATLKSKWGSTVVNWWQECTIRVGKEEYRFVNKELKLKPRKG